MNQGKRGRPKKDPHKIITPEQIEQARIKIVEKERVSKYKKLQLYYYFGIGREYLNSGTLAEHERIKIRRKLDILDELDIPHVLGQEKILSPENLIEWVDNLYDHRFELQRVRVIITRKTRLACAAQRVVRLFGLDIVYLDRVTENGRLEHRYRGAKPHCDADMCILNEWLERDRQSAVINRAERD